MNYPKASVEDYKQALIKVRDKHHISKGHVYLDLLIYQATSKNGTTTATRMAEHVGFKEYRAVNTHYGKYAHMVADALGFTPDIRETDGTHQWWTALSSGEKPSDESLDGHGEFVMHPELKQALIEMRWVST